MITITETAKTPIININRKRGDTRALVFVIQIDGTLIDISLWTTFLLTVTSIKNPPDDSTKVFQLAGTFVTDGTDSKIAFVPAGTTDIGTYYYDVQAIDPAGGKFTLVEGKYKLSQDKTKD